MHREQTRQQLQLSTSKNACKPLYNTRRVETRLPPLLLVFHFWFAAVPVYHSCHARMPYISAFIPHVPRKRANAALNKSRESSGRLSCGCDRRGWRQVRLCRARPTPPRNEHLSAREHPAKGVCQHKQQQTRSIFHGEKIKKAHQPTRTGSSFCG